MLMTREPFPLQITCRTLAGAAKKAREVLVPAMVSSWRFWPAVQLISYSPLVPVDYKLLWIDTMVEWFCNLRVVRQEVRYIEVLGENLLFRIIKVLAPFNVNTFALENLDGFVVAHSWERRISVSSDEF